MKWDNGFSWFKAKQLTFKITDPRGVPSATRIDRCMKALEVYEKVRGAAETNISEDWASANKNCGMCYLRIAKATVACGNHETSATIRFCE